MAMMMQAGITSTYVNEIEASWLAVLSCAQRTSMEQLLTSRAMPALPQSLLYHLVNMYSTY